jgi:hypothetical protein
MGSLGSRLPADQAAAGAEQIVAAMERTPASDSIWSELDGLLEHMELEDIISVLKSVVCIGGLREMVLTEVEDNAHQSFDNDLWKAVGWAETQQPGIVENAPRYPLSASG